VFILIPIHTKGFIPLCTRLASKFANCSLMTLKIISHKFNMGIKKPEFDADFEFIEKLTIIKVKEFF
jgi:hypothetical protein